MKIEVFKEIVELLKKQNEKDSAVYTLNIDLTEFNSPLQTVISHLIGSIYGREGLDTFDWWCCDKEWGTRTDLEFKLDDGTILCETIDDLHQYLESNIVDDYELPHKYTDDERLEILKEMFK